jgi:hypothetical protein
MTRYVVNNSQVPHLWANQSQDSARGNGSISFEGKALFSYRAHIAHLVDAVDGRRIALHIDRTWSNTTSKHQSYARCATSHLTSFVVPFVDPNEAQHMANLEHLRAKYETEARRLARKSDLAEWHCEHVRSLAADVLAYAVAFGLPRITPDVESAIATARTAVAARQAKANTPQAIAKREAAREKAAAKRERLYTEAQAAARLRYEETRRKHAEWLEAERLSAPEKIAAWRNGTRIDLPREIAVDGAGGALIRIRGDVLETSLGASVPLGHAIAVFRRVAACREAQREWHRNGETIRVGGFQVDRINPDGSFRAGCHSFNWPEIEAVAKQAGVI